MMEFVFLKAGTCDAIVPSARGRGGEGNGRVRRDVVRPGIEPRRDARPDPFLRLAYRRCGGDAKTTARTPHCGGGSDAIDPSRGGDGTRDVDEAGSFRGLPRDGYCSNSGRNVVERNLERCGIAITATLAIRSSHQYIL